MNNHGKNGYDRAAYYLSENRPQEALEILRKRLRSPKPDYETLIHSAVAYRGVGNVERALELCDRATTEYPTRPHGWHNLANCFTDLGKFDKVPGLFTKALQVFESSGTPPSQAKILLLGFAYSLMRLGQFEHVWPIWESARLNASWSPFPSMKVWQGERSDRLLFLPEGGIGDGFLMSRFMQSVPATYVIWDKLHEFAKAANITHLDRFLPLSHEFQLSELEQRYSHCAGMLSLLSYCGIASWSDIERYRLLAPTWRPMWALEAPPNDWIGLCWQAEENGVMRRTRSLDHAAASQLSSWLSKRCDSVVSLVPHPQNAALHNPEVPFQIPTRCVHDDARLSTWENTAFTILKCRHIVTVDTAVAHLAGSLGVPTTILLPLSSDWRYGTRESHAERTSWYGNNVNVFRNNHPRTWNIDGIKKHLDYL